MLMLTFTCLQHAAVQRPSQRPDLLQDSVSLLSTNAILFRLLAIHPSSFTLKVIEPEHPAPLLPPGI